MTGEMYKNDVTREEYPIHFEIADDLGGSVEPFDQYQGPYVLIGKDIRSGDEPYQTAPHGFGIVRLWVTPENDTYTFTVFNEASGRTSEPFFWSDPGAAVAAAHSVIN